jgi:hypothetical protein
MQLYLMIIHKLERHLRMALRHVLQLIFGFNKWHIMPLKSKRYAQDIISYCNKWSQHNSYVEIGCGLGDIIRNVHCKQRIGYDIAQNVLNAAGFLSQLYCQKNISFHTFTFPEDEILVGGHDCIVLVNWIHNIQPSVLKENIEKYFTENINDNGFIIIDTVQDEEYQFNHDIKFLTSGLSCSIEKIGDYERQRKVWAIKKIMRHE